MENKIAFKPRFAGIAARGLVVAFCLSVAPMALANAGATSAPDGAGYLLSYGSNYYQGSASQSAGNNVGSYAAAFDTPEPATWGMFGLGLAMIGMGAAARRRRALSR